MMGGGAKPYPASYTFRPEPLEAFTTGVRLLSWPLEQLITKDSHSVFITNTEIEFCLLFCFVLTEAYSLRPSVPGCFSPALRL